MSLLIMYIYIYIRIDGNSSQTIYWRLLFRTRSGTDLVEHLVARGNSTSTNTINIDECSLSRQVETSWSSPERIQVTHEELFYLSLLDRYLTKVDGWIKPNSCDNGRWVARPWRDRWCGHILENLDTYRSITRSGTGRYEATWADIWNNPLTDSSKIYSGEMPNNILNQNGDNLRLSS